MEVSFKAVVNFNNNDKNINENGFNNKEGEALK